MSKVTEHSRVVAWMRWFTEVRRGRGGPASIELGLYIQEHSRGSKCTRDKHCHIADCKVSHGWSGGVGPWQGCCCCNHTP